MNFFPSFRWAQAAHKLRQSSTLAWQRLVMGVMIASAARIQSLSPAAARRFANWLGRVAFDFGGKARRNALANLRLAYDDALSDADRFRLVRGVFRHFAHMTVEFLRAPGLTRDALSSRVSCEGWEHVAAAQMRGKGLLLVTAHLGNWEILGRWLTNVQGLNLTVVAREPENPELGRYMRRMREGAGFAVLSKGESARGLLRILKRGDAICLLPDQNSGDLFAPFFSVPAGTVAGPASLALHSGAPLIPLYCTCRPDGGFHVVCHPEIPVVASGDKQGDVLRIMTHVNRVLESMVREHPEQWLWLHNRWKSAFEEKNRDRAWGNAGAYEAARARRHA